MTRDPDIDSSLHRALDEVQLPATIPPDVLHRARRGRGVKLVALVVAIVGFGTYWSVAGTSFLSSVRIEPANRHTIPFAPLPVEAGSEIEGLAGSPLAPPQFPDCTDDLVDIRLHTTDDAADVTLRPNPGVQCGLDWATDAAWVGADGERYEPPRARAAFADGPREGRLLLMGDAGASHWAVVAGPACRLQAPISYFISLGGEEVEVADIEEPRCSSRRATRTQVFRYRMGGVETPAGRLDAELETPAQTHARTLHFVLSLSNTTDHAIVLSRCPFFDATFEASESTGHLRSYLNCPAAPDQIEPGDELRFPIELPLHGVTGTGRIRLVLSDEQRPLQRIVSGPITVSR